MAQHSNVVVLRGRGRGPLVLGKVKPCLTEAEDNVVQALLDAGEEGLSMHQLEKKSGHTEARKVLARLRKSDGDWEKVIHMARRKGCPYRILGPSE